MMRPWPIDWDVVYPHDRREIPISAAVHREIGPDRALPDASLVNVRAATVVHVCTFGDCRLVVVGVSSGLHALHSVVVCEDDRQVRVGALVGEPAAPGGARGPDRVSAPLVWVAEVLLKEPLGRRTVTAMDVAVEVGPDGPSRP